MFKNVRSIVVIGIALFFFFFLPMLSTVHLNVLMDYFIETGWTGVQINAPQTAGGWISLLVFILGGTALNKFGIAKSMACTFLIMGLAAVGLSFSSDNYPLFFVSLLTLRSMTPMFQLGGIALLSNWFIKTYGRAIGISSAGAPLFTAIGLPALTFIVAQLGMQAYLVVAGILFSIALLIALFVKDTPEEVGLYPDGVKAEEIEIKTAFADSQVNSQSQTIQTEPLTPIQILTDKRTWKIVTSIGLMMTIMTAIMGMNSQRFAELTLDGDVNLWVSQAIPALSLSAFAGIAISYIAGWIADKLGAIKATFFIGILMFCALIPLAFMPMGGNTVMIASWAFGSAVMSGGISTVHPAIIMEIYGRENFRHVLKWVITANSFLATFAPTIMAWFYDRGILYQAYYFLIAILVIAVINLLILMKTGSRKSAPIGVKKKASI